MTWFTRLRDRTGRSVPDLIGDDVRVVRDLRVQWAPGSVANHRITLGNVEEPVVPQCAPDADVLARLGGVPALAIALDLQGRVLAEFHARAAAVLGNSVPLRPYTNAERSIERNLFSSLFLGVQRCVGLTDERLLPAGLINQCMRAWVTACDNLLDDEGKTVIPFHLPDGGTRFASVLTLMTADRILTELIAEEMERGSITAGRAAELSRMTLHALIPSGLQEHEEEPGVDEILPPEVLLERIHVPKTGLLFEAPIRVAEWMLGGPTHATQAARAGLRCFGLACQIIDDIVDLPSDLSAFRHNYVLSSARWASGAPTVDRWAYDSGAIDTATVTDATRCACERSAALFAEARESLCAAGVTLADDHWYAVVSAIPVLLRLPEEPQRHFVSAVEPPKVGT